MHIEINRSANLNKERAKVDSEIAAVREAVASVSESSEKLISSLVKEVDQNIDSQEKAIKYLQKSGWLDKYEATIYNIGLGDAIEAYNEGKKAARMILAEAYSDWKAGYSFSRSQDFGDILAKYGVDEINDIMKIKHNIKVNNEDSDDCKADDSPEPCDAQDVEKDSESEEQKG